VATAVVGEVDKKYLDNAGDSTGAEDDAPTGLSHAELAAMSSKHLDYRKKFSGRAQRKVAAVRAITEAKKGMIRENNKLVSWRKADRKKIGETTQSMGIQMYFDFLYGGATMFFVWGLLLLFTILACLADSGESDDKTGASGLALFSLATFGDSTEQEIRTPAERTVELYGTSYTAADLTPIMSALSAAGALLYFFYVLRFLHVKIARDVEALDADSVTPSDFTVIVEALPNFEQVPAASYELELKKHFCAVLAEEKFRRSAEKVEGGGGVPTPNDFEVVDAAAVDATVPGVSFARDYGGRLAGIAAEAKLKEKIVEAKLDEDAKKLEKLQKQAEKLDAKKKKRKSKHDGILEHDREIFRAYVSFEKSQDQKLILDSYRMSSFFFGWLFQSKNLRFHGKRIQVARAPEPSNIMWENQDCPAGERFRRRCVTKVLVLLLLVITTAGILWSQQKQKEETEKAAGKDCAEEIYVPGSTTDLLTPATATAYLQGLPAGTALKDHFSDCHCSAIGISNMSGDLKTACESYYDTQVMMLLVTTGSSLLVVAINFVMKSGLVGLANYERPLTVSGLECAISTKVFVALFLNTALLVWLLNLKWFWPISEVLKGEGQDFSHAWYATVGLAISTTLMINVASPHLIQVALSFVIRLKQCCLGRCCAKTEEQIANAYEPPVFELAPRCGALLNTLFSTLFFAAGCPILIWFACLNHVLCYLADKYLLFRVSKRPPAYDEQVIKDSLAILPYAFFAHAVMGVWMLGNRNVFPSEELIHIPVPDETPAVFKPLLTLVDRSFVAAGFPYLILLLVVSAYLVLKLLKLVLGSAFGAVASCLLNACCKGQAKSLEALYGSEEARNAEDLTTYRVSQEEWRGQKMVCSYFMRDNEKYRFMATADVDLEAFATLGVVTKLRGGGRASITSSAENSPVKGAGKIADGSPLKGVVEDIVSPVTQKLAAETAPPNAIVSLGSAPEAAGTGCAAEAKSGEELTGLQVLSESELIANSSLSG